MGVDAKAKVEAEEVEGEVPLRNFDGMVQRDMEVELDWQVDVEVKQDLEAAKEVLVEAEVKVKADSRFPVTLVLETTSYLHTLLQCYMVS